MCGIAGWLRWDGEGVPLETLKKITRVLSHRGPDGEGYYAKNFKEVSVGLGHRRLKIIDLITGDQPMSNEDKSIWIVYNGELYNFPTLRKELENAGHTFSTRSDTEVIIHLYEEKGIECLEEMNGMFAFAIWDENKKRLFLARDRLGIKPLYYWEGEKQFAFASEIKSLLQIPGFPRDIDPMAINYFLTFQYIPSPYSIYRGVKKLPPAHFLIWEKGKVTVRKYWKLDFIDPPDRGEKFYRKKIKEIIEDAVKIRLVSDVPFGAFLSGGIDSTIVVGSMSKYLQEPVKTFSMGFDVASFNELRYARIASRHFSTQHYEFIVKPPNVIEFLPLLIWHFDEPFGDSSAIPTYMVSQLARKYVTMVLSGDGGDEVFAGYHRYLADRLLDYFHPFFSLWRNKVLKKLIWSLPETTRINDFSRRFKRLILRQELEPALRYLSWLVIFDEQRRRSLFTEEFYQEFKDLNPLEHLIHLYHSTLSNHPLSKAQFVDTLSYLPEDILTKVDRTTMANSLENRVPLLDYRLVEFMAAVPSHYKLRGFWMKYILKKAFREDLPLTIYYRGKHGFGVPIGNWFKKELREFAQNILLDKRTLDRGYFKPKEVQRILEEHQRGKIDHSHRIWGLLILELWHRFYIDKKMTFEPGLKVEDL